MPRDFRTCSGLKWQGLRVKMIATPVDCGGDYVAVLFIIRHPRNQRLLTADPGVAEVGAQFLFKMSGQRVGPPEF